MSDGKTASIDELNELHAEIARSLRARIASGEATAAELAVAVKFLKDNGIEAKVVPGSPMAGLLASLPFASEGLEHRN